MKYKYDKLAHPAHEVRIAILEPGAFDDAIIVRFMSRNLQDEGPSYEALSYVWGAEDSPSYIGVSSGRKSGAVPITQNLDVALRHLRYGQDLRALWIDALCIDQTDNQEKAVQVLNMGTVFAKASRVISWLGPEEANSNKAVGLLQKLAQEIHIDWETFKMWPRTQETSNTSGFLARWAPKRRIVQSLKPMEVGGHLRWTPDDYQSVYSMLIRPYFRRAWILQEIRLARRVLFQCGFTIFDEDDFWTAVYYMSQRSGPKTSAPEYWQRAIKYSLKLAYLRAREEVVSFVGLRRYTGGALCRDPRDKIYSTLGIMEPLVKDLQIRPTYTGRVEDVYLAVTRRIYTAWSCLDLLEACELSSRSLDIPSWVPDWSCPLVCEEYLPLRWSACAWIASQPRFDQERSRCAVAGIRIAQITELDSLDRETPNTTGDVFEFIRKTKPSILGPDNLYITDQTLMEAYCSTLIADGFRDHNQPDLADYGLPDFTHSLGLLELAWTEHLSDGEYEDAVNGTKTYFHAVHRSTKNRRIFITDEGHIGLAPLDTKAGDSLVVLFGSRFPIILRPAADQTWVVVGHCYAHGLMDGEAIYRGKHAVRYASRRLLSGGQTRSRVAFVSQVDGTLNSDFSAILEEAGIKVEHEQDEPPALFVLPETLRAAGLQVQDFTLV